MNKLVLAYDLETGGSFDLPPEENFITEVGAVLWDIDAKMPVKIYNTLVGIGGREVSEEAEQYTGITTAQCRRWGVEPLVAFSELRDMLLEADYVMAHNGRNFDNIVIMACAHREGAVTSLDFDINKKPLIDTMTDIPYPPNAAARNLTYLAGFHLILNSFPHRAVSDVLTMCTIFSKYDWNVVEEIVNSPTIKLAAKFDYPNERRLGARFPEAMKEFNRVKDAVKNLGFKWKPESKQWILESRKVLTKDMVFPCPVTEIQE